MNEYDPIAGTFDGAPLLRIRADWCHHPSHDQAPRWAHAAENQRRARNLEHSDWARKIVARLAGVSGD